MLLLIKQELKLLPNSSEVSFIIRRSERGPVMSSSNKKSLILDANFSSQNESLHLLFLTMDIKAGITLQQSSSYIKGEHCLQRKKERRSWENLCSPGFFLERNFFWGVEGG